MKNSRLYFKTPYKFALELMHKQKKLFRKNGGSFYRGQAITKNALHIVFIHLVYIETFH